MAFDAGAIEATLTLNRNPFTAGIAAARAQISEFKRRNSPIEIDIKINLQQRQLLEAEAILKRFKKEVATATARVRVDRLQFDALRRDLRIFDRSVYSARVDVDTGRATANVIAFRTLLGTLNDQTVNLNANTRGFGRAAGDGFGQGASHFQRMALLIVSFLPIIASGFTAAVGGVGALASAFIIAGLGAGAFALVAVPAFKKIKDAVAGGQAEINKLPPGLREAGNAMKGMQTEYDKLVKSNERITGIALASWFNAGTAALKTLNPLVHAAGEAFSTAGARAQTFFESAWWKQFVGWLSDAMLPATDMLFRSIFALIEIVGNLTRAFWDLGGSEIMGMITTGLEQFAHWTTTIGENKTFQAFMDAAVRSFPVVAKLIGEVVEFIFKLAIALEPLGTLIIRVLNGILDAINSLPLPTIQALAMAIGAFWIALALGAGGPVAIALGVLAGLATAFTYAYTSSQTLRDGINDLIAPIRDWFIPLATQLGMIWDQYVIPAWNRAVAATRENLIPVFEYLWHMFVDNVLPALRGLAVTFTETLLPAILDFWAAIQPFVAWVLKAFGQDIIYAIQLMVTTFDGGFQMVAGLLNIFTGIFTGDWTKFTNGITQITQGFWTIIAGIFGLSLDELRAKVTEWDQKIDGMWHTFWEGITGFIHGVWDTIKLIFSAALDLIHGNVSSAADKIGLVWRKIANLFREPINWVIRTVINPPLGILGAWNAVMGWIGAPSLGDKHLSEIPAFAQGGRVRGKGSGTSDENLALLSNNEFVVRESVARRIMPFLQALNAGQAEALRAANPDSKVDRMMMRFAGGGVANAQRVAESMVGKPYIWGGAGPGGADCSGLWSIITNAARGQNPWSRIGTTANFPWPGFTPGLTSALAIGNSRSRGHMAGTLAGTNYEARQTGTPILRSPAAKGADNGYFDMHYSLPQVGGAFVGGGPGGGAPAPVSWWSIIADKVTALFKGLFGGDIPGAGGVIGDALNNIPRILVDKVIEAIKKKLEALMTFAGNAIAVTAQGAAANPLSGMGTSDLGAIIPPGASTLFNATGQPEPLTNLDVYSRMKPAGLSVEDVLALIEASREGSGAGGDTYNVMLPEKATVRELADTLDFKRRVVSKGRYSR